MAKQTLVIETPKELSLRGNMIVISEKSTGMEILRPLEDVRMLIIDHHSVRITVPLVIELTKNNVAIVVCDEKHMPISMMLDLESNTQQSMRFQKQISVSIIKKKQLWKQIVEAKILNQSSVIEILGKGKNMLLCYARNVKSGDSSNREGIAARIYWKTILGKGFIRDRYGEPPNSLLNYGYSLLRSLVARNLMNAGLLPTIGIYHHNRYNAFPLADDIMEPYRPYVDLKVLNLMERGITDVCHEAKKELIEMTYKDIPANAIMMSASTLADVYQGLGEVVLFPKIL